MTEPPADRDTDGRQQFSAADDLRYLDVDDLVTEADRVVEEEPARRTVTRFLIVVAVCVALLVLFGVLAVQGLGSAAKVALEGSECTVPGCVEVSLADIESRTGVDFPEGTTVEWSVKRMGLKGDQSIHFEVRIPAGVPVPDIPPYRGTPRPWGNEPDPETGVFSGAEDFIDRGLEDVRWAGVWVTGVDANGDSIVFGLDTIPD